MDSYVKNVHAAIIEGEMGDIGVLIELALEAGITADVLMNDGMISAMDEVGDKFEQGELYVPEMLLSAHTMQMALKQLKPLLVEAGIEPVGKVLLATVKGDLHDIGKNLVGMMMEGAGYNVIDLGVNVDPEMIVSAIREEDPDVVGLSALLTTTMVMMGTTLDAISASGLRDQTKVIVGGAPVNQHFADEIGADGFARDAGQAVQLIRLLLSA